MVNISSIEFVASPKQVWDALTKPELVKAWQYGSELITDWVSGSPIRFVAEWQGTVFEQWGTVLEVRPEELIRYNLFAPRPGLADNPENYFIMTYALEKTPTGTHLQISQEDNRPRAVQEDPQGEENPALAALKTMVERHKQS